MIVLRLTPARAANSSCVNPCFRDSHGAFGYSDLALRFHPWTLIMKLETGTFSIAT
jgi:hypothetical protein